MSKKSSTCYNQRRLWYAPQIISTLDFYCKRLVFLGTCLPRSLMFGNGIRKPPSRCAIRLTQFRDVALGSQHALTLSCAYTCVGGVMLAALNVLLQQAGQNRKPSLSSTVGVRDLAAWTWDSLPGFRPQLTLHPVLDISFLIWEAPITIITPCSLRVESY